jgi:release factor glutamine methyltransferase
VSNPPYIAEGEQLPDEVVAWEPTGALIAGAVGIEAIVTIIAGASRWLSPAGVIVLEIAPHQSDAVVALGINHGFSTSVRKDLAGRPRIAIATRAE